MTDVVEQLNKAQMPLSLIHEVARELDKKKDAALLTKFRAVTESLDKNTVIVVLGNDSPLKEKLCAHWLWYLMNLKLKTGRWLTPSRIPASFGELPVGGGVVVVQAIDLLIASQQKTVAQSVRDWITGGRCLILSVTSMPVLEEALGKSCVNYILHHAIVTEVETETPPVLKV